MVTCWARWQFAGQQVGDALEVVVARVAEVRGAEAEEHGHRTAVPALVLQQVGAVLGAHLGAGHVAATAAHQLGRVVVGAAHVQLAPGLAAVIRLRNAIHVKTGGAKVVMLSRQRKTTTFPVVYFYGKTHMFSIHDLDARPGQPIG